LDALHDVRKQFKRNHGLWQAKDEEIPVIGTIAAQFNDIGVNELFQKLLGAIENKTGVRFDSAKNEIAFLPHTDTTTKSQIIPLGVRYLSEISENNRSYDAWVNEQSALASQLYQQLNGTLTLAAHQNYRKLHNLNCASFERAFEEALNPYCKELLQNWPALKKKYSADFLNMK
jgi:methylmalonyl-CoA mutase